MDYKTCLGPRSLDSQRRLCLLNFDVGESTLCIAGVSGGLPDLGSSRRKEERKEEVILKRCGIVGEKTEIRYWKEREGRQVQWMEVQIGKWSKWEMGRMQEGRCIFCHHSHLVMATLLGLSFRQGVHSPNSLYLSSSSRGRGGQP